MPVWLITGGSGFLGGHLLAELSCLHRKNVEIISVGRRLPPDWPADAFRKADSDREGELVRVVNELSPSVVFHLSGKTPPASNDEFYRTNLLSTLRLLDALRAHGRACRIVLVGSAAELGPVPPGDLPVGEDYPCRPAGPYGLSKWLATVAGQAASPPLQVMIARVFNPIGPGLPDTQALGRFAKLLANGSGTLRLDVGDLEPRRDFVDVRDVARGLRALAEAGRAGHVYHLGSGISRRVRDGLDHLILLSGRIVELGYEPTLSRGQNPSDSRADIRKVFAHVGWRPEITWEQSLNDLWEHALGRPHAGLTVKPPSV